VPLVAVCVPAAIAPIASAPALTLAVIVEPFRPNEIPLLFENVILDRTFEVVPAEKLTPTMRVPFVFGSQRVSFEVCEAARLSRPPVFEKP
jgi:hypothetical protein